MLVGLLVLVVVAADGVWEVYKKERESRELRAQAERGLSDLEMRQAQLTADIEKLESDRGVEEALREQYELAEEGERLIVIVDPSISELLEATSTIQAWMKKMFPWW